jgi:hypothetical protein
MAGGMPQSVGPDFKPQSTKKKEKRLVKPVLQWFSALDH